MKGDQYHKLSSKRALTSANGVQYEYPAILWNNNIVEIYFYEHEETSKFAYHLYSLLLKQLIMSEARVMS